MAYVESEAGTEGRVSSDSEVRSHGSGQRPVKAASALRRLVAAAIDWVTVGLLILVLAVGSGGRLSPGVIALLSPLVVFGVASLCSTGVGGLVTRVRIVDAATKTRLRPARACARTVLQLVCAYLVAMLVLVVVVVSAGLVFGVLGVTLNDESPVWLVLVVAVAGAPAVSEYLSVRVTGTGTTPWDAAVHSTVVHRSA